MLSLIFATIVTSVADSLNPVAITQQFVLQGMVKKPRHIWYFIWATAITNFIGGFLVYYGAGAIIESVFANLMQKYATHIYLAEFILGIVLLILTALFYQKREMKALRAELETRSAYEMEIAEERVAAGKIKSVTPLSLFFIGVVACITELTTALPYFGFLAILLSHELSLFGVLFILTLYNLIYASPLMLMYFVYVKFQDKFDRLYLFVKKQMEKWGSILILILCLAAGLFFLFHAGLFLFER